MIRLLPWQFVSAPPLSMRPLLLIVTCGFASFRQSQVRGINLTSSIEASPHLAGRRLEVFTSYLPGGFASSYRSSAWAITLTSLPGHCLILVVTSCSPSSSVVCLFVSHLSLPSSFPSLTCSSLHILLHPFTPSHHYLSIALLPS